MKKAFLLFFSILCGIIISACSTPTVFRELDALVIVEGYIEISLDQKEWKQAIKEEDFDALLAKNYPSFELIPITTETGKPPFYSVDNEKKEEIDSGYIEIPIYFKSATLDQVIWKSATISSLPIAWKSYVDFVSAASQVDKDEDIYASLVNAIRISIEDANHEESIVVYERAAGYHHNHVIGEGGDLSLDGQGIDGYLSYHYAKYQQLLFGAENVVLPNSLSEIKETQQIVVLNMIQSGNLYQGEMVIRIWVEQWDPDCYPIVLSSDFSMQLTFKGKKSD
jgi:hypothetical protein